MKKALYIQVISIILLFCTIVVQADDPTPSPTPTTEPTFNPAGYTLHVLSEGAPRPIPVKYFGDIAGSGETPFDIHSPSPYRIYLEPGTIDIKEGYTSGYYPWYWDAHPYFGYDPEIWGYPVDSHRFYIHSNPEATKNLPFVRYDDPIVLPSPYPTPIGTPPPPVEAHYNIVDSETGQIIQSPGLLVEVYDYYAFTHVTEWTTGVISDNLGYSISGHKLLLVISAPGYHTFVTNFIHASTSSDPKIILLYPESLATPEPANTAVVTHAPEPTPGPNTDPEWRYIVDAYPPEVEFRFITEAEAIISLTVPHTGVRVYDWGIPSVSGNTITVNPKLLVWDGAAPRWNTTMQHTYSLGTLTPGQTYTLFVEEWDTPVESFSFQAEPLTGVVPEYDAPWSLHTAPTLDLEYDINGNTCVTLTASFFEYSIIANSVLSWGEVSQAGTVFTVNPVIIRNEEARSAAAVRYCSKTYDLGTLGQGDYTFRVVIGETEVMNQALDIQNPTPAPTIQALPTSTPAPHPQVKISLLNDTVYYPGTGFTVSVKNYGVPCTVDTHEWLTDDCLSISPSRLELDTGESADFTVTINWNTHVGHEERTSYNAFIITDASRYRKYTSWEVVLNNPDISGLTISGTVEVLEGTTIVLSGDVYFEATPDAAGYYEFINIPEGGNYEVSVSYRPPSPTATILTPSPGEVISGVYDVSFLAQSSVCDYVFTPAQYTYSNLLENRENQDFAIDAVSDCCMLITEAVFHINNVVKYRDYTESMCSHTYTWEFDTREYSDGEYDVMVYAKDERNYLGTAEVPITINNQGTGAGDVWFVPDTLTVNTDEEFALEIHLNSGDQKVAAYGFTLLWDETYISMDYLSGSAGIEAGPDGFFSAPATVEQGRQTISGFDVSGTGPGEDLHFLTVYFLAGTLAGTTVIDLEVNSLADPNAETIGTPEGSHAQITVVSQALTGDVNNDGIVDILDALLTAQYYVGLDPPDFDPAAADVNCDGNIDIVDALLIAQYYVGLISGFC